MQWALQLLAVEDIEDPSCSSQRSTANGKMVNSVEEHGYKGEASHTGRKEDTAVQLSTAQLKWCHIAHAGKG